MEFQAYTYSLLRVLIPKWAKGKVTKRKDEQDDDDDEPDIDRLTARDAWQLPIFGSATLFSLYLAFKYLDPIWINRIFSFYFLALGTASLTRAATKMIGLKGAKKVHVDIKIRQWSLVDLHLTAAQAIIGAMALSATLWNHVVGHWTIMNAVALSFAYNAVSLLRLDSFVTGSILLSGLFFYDVFWVFGTAKMGSPVMETVAKQFDAPIKVIWPRDLAAPSSGFALLGLGDVVLPGVFIALALRYDYERALRTAQQSKQPLPRPTERFAKPYFFSTFSAYILGLITTVVVMHVFRAAQPALLYLSPACIGSVTLCAQVLGEQKQIWAFVDSLDEEGKHETEKKNE